MRRGHEVAVPDRREGDAAEVHGGAEVGRPRRRVGGDDAVERPVRDRVAEDDGGGGDEHAHGAEPEPGDRPEQEQLDPLPPRQPQLGAPPELQTRDPVGEPAGLLEQPALVVGRDRAVVRADGPRQVVGVAGGAVHVADAVAGGRGQIPLARRLRQLRRADEVDDGVVLVAAPGFGHRAVVQLLRSDGVLEVLVVAHDDVARLGRRGEVGPRVVRRVGVVRIVVGVVHVRRTPAVRRQSGYYRAARRASAVFGNDLRPNLVDGLAQFRRRLRALLVEVRPGRRTHDADRLLGHAAHDRVGVE